MRNGSNSLIDVTSCYVTDMTLDDTKASIDDPLRRSAQLLGQRLGLKSGSIWFDKRNAKIDNPPTVTTHAHLPPSTANVVTN